MSTLGLFEGFGIEIEHMIVDAKTLAVRPYADRVLVEDGEVVMELEDGDIAWSNELALHVVELKTNGPAESLEPLGERFRASARRVAERLEPHGATLLPGAMHPFMNPDAEFLRWPHGDSEIYEAFDRIFDCRGHGWSNLQSVHLNLPFRGDEELGRLHAAVRVLLPLLPALAAASPIFEGVKRPQLDARLDVYRTNAKKLPLVSGRVIPEPAFTKRAYEQSILEPMYEAIRPHDPDGILQHEWLNARGAIVRFDRDAIEIRVIDAQESSAADIAICAAATTVLRKLVAGDPERSKRATVDQLAPIFERTVEEAEHAIIDDAEFLALLSFPGRRAKAQEVWHHLLEGTSALARDPWAGPLWTILEHGTLASRLLRATGDTPDRERLVEVFGELRRCLLYGHAFLP